MTNQELITAVEGLWNRSGPAKALPLRGLQQIALQEALETEAYQDSEGIWTIGVGHTPSYSGEVWTINQCLQIFIQDVYKDGVNPVNAHIPWAKDMGVVRWWVFVNMSYNEGIERLMAFTDTLSAAERGDWSGTVQGMKESLWYNQVGQRAVELCKQMETNEWVLPNA